MRDTRNVIADQWSAASLLGADLAREVWDASGAHANEPLHLPFRRDFDPVRFDHLAEAVRAMADTMDGEPRRIMLRLARTYDRLAEWNLVRSVK